MRARRTHKTRASDVAVATPAAGVESAFPGHVPLLGKRHESTGAARRTIVDGNVLELLLDDILQARHTGGSFERDEEREGAGDERQASEGTMSLSARDDKSSTGAASGTKPNSAIWFTNDPQHEMSVAFACASP